MLEAYKTIEKPTHFNINDFNNMRFLGNVYFLLFLTSIDFFNQPDHCFMPNDLRVFAFPTEIRNFL